MDEILGKFREDLVQLSFGVLCQVLEICVKYLR